MYIVLSNSSDLPIYEQIKEQVKTQILSGELSENEMLPSLRQLAKDLKISVLTTTRAYNELEEEGFITSRQGKGFFVMPRGSDLLREQLIKDVETNLNNAILSAQRASMTDDELVQLLKLLLRYQMNNNVYLKLENVKKSFANFELDNVSFSLPKGYIMGLIGSNGAGKTTTIKLILNMLDIENGNIEVLGKDYKENEKEIKQNIGVVFDSNFFVDTWTIKETEQALSVFYHEWNNEKFRLILKRFGLPLSKKINELSRGMQMKLMLACAFSHNAKLLILDEPTSGLDPATRNEFLEILQEFIQDGEKSVLFSTHITTDLERITDYITYLENGRVIYTGDMDGLMQKYYLIKGEPAKLTNELKKDILGIRSTTIGFEGLVETKLAHKYKGYILDVPTIDDIIICMSKEGKG